MSIEPAADQTVNLQAKLKEGLALHRQGNLAEAERIYSQILQQQPICFEALHLLGLLSLQMRRTRLGVELISKAIAIDDNIAPAHNNFGNGLRSLKRPEEALASYDKAIALKPDFIEAYYNRGNVLRDLNHPEEALASYDKAIALKPDFVEAHYNRGNILINLNRPEEALASCDKAIALKPNFVMAYSSRGYALINLNRPEEALESYDKAIALKPDFAEAYINRGSALQDLKRPQEALESYDKAIALKPDFAEAYINRGSVLQDFKRPNEALASYDNAIALRPDYAEAYKNRGHALHDLNRPEEALASYDKAIALKPDYAEAYINRGNTLRDLKRLEDALTSCDKAIALKPDYAEAYINRGNILRELERLEDALISCDKAIALKPDLAAGYNSRGNALINLKRPEEAMASYDNAIALEPDYAEAHVNRGNALRDLGRPEEALTNYDEAFYLKPNLSELEGLRLFTKMRLCNWSGFDTTNTHLISSVRNGHANTSPFVLLTVPHSSTYDQLRCAKLWVENKYPLSENLLFQGKKYNHHRIRIAYCSADFYSHAVASLAVELFEQHDRSRFEIIGVSWGIDDRSEMRKRLIAAFDTFHDVRGRHDREVFKLIRELEVDIAIDLTGYTHDSRFGIFTYRPAPIQVNYLGYPGTMGTQFIDYVIADRIVAPLEHQKFYAEKIVHLPDCYQINDTKRKIAEPTPMRQAEGLPERVFVFCCFNNNYKLTPNIFDVWMRILKRVDDSVLWLLEDYPTASANLRKEAVARGVNAERLIFAKRVPPAEHLARHQCADLFLDTMPYNAHTTASDALWAGLPVLTCMGRTFAGRVAASLLTAIGLHELIATTLEDYERLAIELASNPKQFGKIKQRLTENRLTTPLFDTRLFTKHIEAAYGAMYERHQAGLPPEYIAIPNS